MRYKESVTSNIKRVLCLIMAITMLLPVSNLWALDVVITTNVGQQELADGDTLTVADGGAVTIEGTDENTSAVLNDVATGTTGKNHDAYGITDGEVTVDAGGSISVDVTTTATLSPDFPDYEAYIHARGIEAEDGVTISNSGSISATITDDFDNYAHAFAIQVHSLDGDPGNVTINNYNSITADATGTNSASAWGIKTGEDIPSVAIDNAGKITVMADGEIEGNARGIHISQDTSGTITNSGDINATATSDEDSHARGLHIGEDDSDDDTINVYNLTGATITATSTSYNSAGIFNGSAYGIQAGDSIIGLIDNDGDIVATATGGDGSKAIGIKAEASWVLENSGTVKADLTVKATENDIEGSSAIALSANRDDSDKQVIITNQEGGELIAVSDYEVTDGYIDTHSGSYGIKMASYGAREVSNYGTISATSDLETILTDSSEASTYIYSNTGAYGIKIGQNSDSADEASVENYGTITAKATMTSAEYIYGNSGAYGARISENSYGKTEVTNEGTISGTATMTSAEYIEGNSGAFGLRLGSTDNGGDTEVTNDGTISANATMKAVEYLSGNSGAFGIRAGYTNSDSTTTVTNNDTIEATANMTITDEAGHTDNNIGAFGIKVGNGSVDGSNYNVNITNAGTITATATIDTPSVNETDNGGRGAYGIRTGTAKIINSGDITSTAIMNGTNDGIVDGAYGIRTGEGEATVISSGTITAQLTDNDATVDQRAVGIMTGQSDNQIHLSGDVTATSNNDEAYAIIMGCTNSGGSNNELYVLNGASMTGDVLNVGDSVANVTFGLGKDTTGMATPGLRDTDFSFAYDGSFLAGNGSGWNAELVAGSLAGNIVIDGDYTQQADATYQALLGDGAAAELEISGNADFAEGAIIEIGTAGYVADGSVHTIVNSATLTPADDADQEALLTESTLVLDYTLVEGEATKISILADRASYASVGASSNAIGVSTALIAMSEDGSSNANSYIGLVDSCDTVDCINDGYAALAPEQYPALLDISQAGNAAFGSVISGRMGNLHIVKGTQDMLFAESTITKDGPVSSRLPAFDSRAEGWSSWARVFGVFGEQDSDGPMQGFEYDSYGISAGADNKISSTTAIGFGLGYADTEADFENNSQGSDIESIFASVYGTYSVDSYYVDAAVTYASNDYDSVRAIPLASLNASSSTDGQEIGMMIGAGCKAIDMEDMYFIPTASLTWGKLDIDGFTETGAGAFNLDVGDFDATSFMSTLGFRWGATMGTDSKFEPELRLAWAHEFGDTDRDTMASFTGQPESFMIKSVERDADSAVAGLGMNYYFKENVTLYLDYDGEYRDGYDAHALSGGFRYDF